MVLLHHRLSYNGRIYLLYRARFLVVIAFHIHRKYICNYNTLFRLRNVYLTQKLIHNIQLFVRYFYLGLMNIYLLSYHPFSNKFYCLYFSITGRKIISVFRRNNNLLFSMRNNKTIIRFV